jgi:hypothetical protein
MMQLSPIKNGIISAGVNLCGGRDPRFAYENCVWGQEPVRPYGAS